MAKKHYKGYNKYKIHPSVYEDKTKQRKEKKKSQPSDRRVILAQRFVVASFLSLLGLVGILSLVLPKPTVSDYEKRMLATMPSFSVRELFWGEYLRDVEMFYADTFPFRDGFVRMAAVVDETRGVRVDGVRLIEARPSDPAPTETEASRPEVSQPQVSRQETEQSDTEKAQDGSEAEEEPAAPYVVEDDGAIGEQTNDGLFIYKNKAMSIFGGNNDMGTRYANTLNGYAAALPGVNVYNVVVPTAIEFGLPERYKSVTNSQKDSIDHIYGLLDGVTSVDAYSEIERHAGEYVYFNTDHHWTGLGAYYAYVGFCKAAGIEPLTMEEYDIRRLDEEFLGTLYAQTNDSAVKAGADTVEYYIVPGEFEVYRYDAAAPDTPVAHSIWAEYASGPYCYAVFLHGDFPLMDIRTDVGNGRKALVVKESFGNAFAPFLVAHYDQVYVVDQRYFTKGLASFIRQNGVDDLIFINNAYAANTLYHIEKIEGMLY